MIFYPAKLAHNNPNLSIVRSTDIYGGAKSILLKADRLDMPMESRQTNTMVAWTTAGGIHEVKMYVGPMEPVVPSNPTGEQGASDTEWDNDTNWQEVGGSALELGESEDTAYRGDHGLAAYTHSLVSSGNPHGVTHAEVGPTAAGSGVAMGHITTGTQNIYGLKIAIATVSTNSTTVIRSFTADSPAYSTYLGVRRGAASTNVGLDLGVDQNGTLTTLLRIDYDRTIKLVHTPATAAGSYPVLVRNPATGVIELGSSSYLTLGESSTTAYRGDRGKTAYDHTSLSNNPHSVLPTQINLGRYLENISGTVAGTSIGGSIRATNNTTGSEGFPTELGATWFFDPGSVGRDFAIHKVKDSAVLYYQTITEAGAQSSWQILASREWVAGQGFSQLVLGETSITAYRGDRGKIAYDHTSLINNPHNVTPTQVNAGRYLNDSGIITGDFVINSIRATSNTTGSTGRPSEYGNTWTFNGGTASRVFDLYQDTQGSYKLSYRSYDASGVARSWLALATESWVTGQGFLTSEVDTLNSVIQRGNVGSDGLTLLAVSTNNDVGAQLGSIHRENVSLVSVNYPKWVNGVSTETIATQEWVIDNALWAEDTNGINSRGKSLGLGDVASSATTNLTVSGGGAPVTATGGQEISNMLVTQRVVNWVGTTDNTSIALKVVSNVGGSGYASQREIGLHVQVRADSDSIYDTIAARFLNGYVGVGVELPEQRLHVRDGVIRLDSSTSGGIANMGVNDSTGGYINGYDNLGVQKFTIRGYESGGTQGYFLAGNMGFGTSVPSTKIGVKGAGANGLDLMQDLDAPALSTRLFFTNNVGGNSIRRGTEGLLFSTGAVAGTTSGTVRATLTDEGNFGVGTATPAYPITSVGEISAHSSDGSLSRARMVAVANGGIVAAIDSAGISTFYVRSYDSSGIQGWFTAGYMGFGTSSPDAMVHIHNDLGSYNSEQNLKITSATGRPCIVFDPVLDRASDLSFKSMGVNKWLLSVRDSSESHAFRIYRDNTGTGGLVNALEIRMADGAIAFGGVFFKFPTIDGANNEVLTTNGSGTLSWTTKEGVGSGGITSINGQSQATQTITGGTGIGVSSTGGVHTISMTGSVVTTFNNRTGAVVLTSADVTTALGYTPRTGTVTSVATSGSITGGTITSSGTITHLTTAGHKHLPTGGSVGQVLKNTASGTATWQTESKGVTSVGTSGSISGGTITGTGTITHLTVAGHKHIPTGGTVGQILVNTGSGTASWQNEFVGVTSVATSGSISGGTITGIGTITHLTSAGHKHIPTGGDVGQVLKNTASGTVTWQDESKGVTSVATSGAITGGTITGTGTISHSTATGYKHIPIGGSSGQYLRYYSDGTAIWGNIRANEVTPRSFLSVNIASNATYDWNVTTQRNIYDATLGYGDVVINISAMVSGEVGVLRFKSTTYTTSLYLSYGNSVSNVMIDSGADLDLETNTEYVLTAVHTGATNHVRFNLAKYVAVPSLPTV